jgi:glycine oxidase
MIPDLLIIGGGAVGLSLADLALREGLRVQVLDKGPMGREASWAGAGMLTCRPRPKRNNAEYDYHDLKILSVRMHAEWAKRLLEETGIDVGYRVCGAIELIAQQADIPTQRQEAVSFQEWIDACNARGVRARMISTAEACKMEPALTGDFASAIEFPDEAQVRNPRFLRALLTSIKMKGGEICEGRQVADLLIENDTCRGVVLVNGERVSAKATAVCAGAWTSQIPALARAVPAITKIYPVRGQILCYQTDPKLARRLLTLDNHYLVPRGDGMLLVGATHDNAGYDKSITENGTKELQDFGHWILPELRKLKPLHMWTGLRPGLKGRHPLLGPVSKIPSLFVAVGHYRNGLNLAPASAQLVLASILGKTSEIPVKTWLPDQV